MSNLILYVTWAVVIIVLLLALYIAIPMLRSLPGSQYTHLALVDGLLSVSSTQSNSGADPCAFAEDINMVTIDGFTDNMFIER